MNQLCLSTKYLSIVTNNITMPERVGKSNIEIQCKTIILNKLCYLFHVIEDDTITIFILNMNPHCVL